MTYTAWDIWKERNRRNFDGVFSTSRRMLQLIKDEMALRNTGRELAVESVAS
jgi:hypothetical protein